MAQDHTHKPGVSVAVLQGPTCQAGESILEGTTDLEHLSRGPGGYSSPSKSRLPGLEVLVFMPSPALLSCFPLVYDDVRTVVTDFVHLSTDPQGSCSPVSSWSLLTAPKIVLGVYLRH